MINVVEQIIPLLNFESTDDFYYLQIIKRKKENPGLNKNSKIVKNYYIKSSEELLSKMDEIIAISNATNARAMLRLNKRSFIKVGLKTLQNVANIIAQNDYKDIRNAYDKACGQISSDSVKKWIIDLDGNDVSHLDTITQLIETSSPIGNKILTQLPTKNGIHLITMGFDVRELRSKFPHIDIHKDNPINLYIP